VRRARPTTALALAAALATAAPAPAATWDAELVRAPQAHAVERGAGVVVAVLDTGIAYRSEPPHRRSPALPRWRFVEGFDALLGRRPHDLTGHGTHVAMTVLAGAPGVRLMPVRVLDAAGRGTPEGIAAGVRAAVRRGADVLALALSLREQVRVREVPELVGALEEARRRGVVVVASAGNRGADEVPLPARHWSTIAVGAVTARGCGAADSGYGERLDLVAPGGGADADVPGDPACRPDAPAGPGICALSFRGFGTKLRELERTGTSFAVAHVAAAAALLRGAGVTSPRAIRSRLRATARDLGEPGPDLSYGRGLLDSAAAVGTGHP
jgi:serine protease